MRMRRFSRRSRTSSRNDAQVAPRLADADPVLGRAAERLGARGGIGLVAVGPVRRPHGGAAACSTPPGRRRASGSGRRGPRSRRAARPSCPRGCRTSGGGARAPRPASHSSILPMPGALEDLRLLAHHDHGRLPDAGRQPAHRVQERAEVDARWWRRAGAGSSSSTGATARARAAASRPTSAAASCTCGGRARPRRTRARRPAAATRRDVGGTRRRGTAIGARRLLSGARQRSPPDGSNRFAHPIGSACGQCRSSALSGWTMLSHGPATDRTACCSLVGLGRLRRRRRIRRRRSRRRRPRSACTENQGELKAAIVARRGRRRGASAWRACAPRSAARASRAPSPARCGCALLTGQHHPRRPRAPHARLRRRPRAPPRRLDRRARRRAAAPSSATVDSLAAAHLLDARAGCAPTFLVLRRNTEFWTHARVPGRLAAHHVRPRPGGVPVLPRPRACSSSRWRAGARRTGWRGQCLRDAREGAPPRRLPGARAAPHRRPPARARRPRAATSSPGSTTSAGAAARRRGSAA